MRENEQQSAEATETQTKSTCERRPYDTVKRAIDLSVSAVGLIATAPVIAGVAVTVRIAHGTPILFRQARPGRGGEIFDILKFRTMRIPDETHVTDGQRLTPLGRFLRASSLDELPSLLNVLRGEMSLVGPRPLHVEYLERYTPEQSRRHEVLPGITGLAQISGRNAIDWEDRFRLDVEYVDRRCLRLDVRILLQTVRTVLSRKGINKPGCDTMSKFTGQKDAGETDA